MLTPQPLAPCWGIKVRETVLWQPWVGSLITREALPPPSDLQVLQFLQLLHFLNLGFIGR